MAEDEEEYQQESEPEELSDKQKIEIAKWFLTNSPPGEIQYVAKDVRSVLMDEHLYNMAVSEAFPVYNKTHIISLELPDRSGDVLVTTYGELNETEYLDPRTAQVATVDHVKQKLSLKEEVNHKCDVTAQWELVSKVKLLDKQYVLKILQICKDLVCTEVRPATDEELPSPYIEEFRCALDAEIIKYVEEAYPKGVCSVYCTDGKDVEGPGSDFELAVLISAARHSPQNFCNGSWRSIWNVQFKDDMQMIELRCTLQVGAHYFEEGNVQLDANHECNDSTIFQSSDDCAISITNIIRHHETEYLASLEGSYLNLPDTTFKDLRRKLPVTRTLFPWHNTLQISLNRDITKEIGTGK